MNEVTHLSQPVVPDQRRLICPSLKRPMATGDGCLVRLAPLDASLDAAMLQHLAQVSRQLGNGQVEITRRGNLQCRGFPCRDDDAFKPWLGQLPGQKGSRFPISLDPVGLMNPGCAPVMRDLYQRLHQRLHDSTFSTTVAPKITMVISAGGGVGIDSLVADIQLHLVAVAEGYAIQVGLGASLTPGDMRWQGQASNVEQAIEAVMTLLSSIEQQGQLARARHVASSAIPSLKLMPTAVVSVPEHALGATLTEPVMARIWAVPRGRLSAEGISALADICAQQALSVWPLPHRRLLMVGASVTACDDALRQSGLLDDPHHPLAHIDLCAGLACSRARLDTHATAVRLVSLLAFLPVPISVHLSGCPKCCARDTAALLTITGYDSDGVIGVVLDGAPGDPPLWTAENPAVLWEWLARWIQRVAQTPDRCQQRTHWHACWQALHAEHWAPNGGS